MKDFKEQFLSEYFTTAFMVENMTTYSQRKELFFSLADAFLIDFDSAEVLWEISQRERVRNITSVGDFKMYGRTNQYITQIMNVKLDDGDEEHMIAVKGNALEAAMEFELPSREEKSKEKIFKTIVYRAGEGCLAAMRILAIMQIKGIYIDQDVESGIKNLARAAKWNDINAAMEYLYYSKGMNGESFCNRLLSVLEIRCFKDLAKTVKAAYPQYSTGKRDEVARLLEKAFGNSVLDRDVYSSIKARIVFSEILPLHNKEAIIYSIDAKQMHSPVCDLPLKLKKTMEYTLDESAFDGMIFQRPDERQKIMREAQNFDLCRLAGYMPMCLCSDSGVLMRSYVETVKRLLPQAHVEVIEVRSLGVEDLTRGFGNVFVKSCEEEKFNVYVMVFRGKIDSKVMEEALKFLQSSNRKEFRLSSGVELDLSSILPICVCDKINDDILKRCCHLINLADVSASEKSALVDEVLSRKASLYGIEAIVLDEEVRPSIEQLSIDNIERALDKAILDNRIKSGELVLGMQMFGKILAEYKSNNRFGFGGSINEDK